MTDTIVIGNTQNIPQTAIQLITGGDPPALIQNSGPGVLYVGDNDAIRWNDANGIVPINVNGYLNVDGSRDLFATVQPGNPTTVYLISGGINFFSPPSLSGLGGIKSFVQATAPTPPPVIPVNSLWFNTTLNALETYDGSNWNIEAFAGNELIVAGTIATNLLIANFFQGYEIDGAIFRAKNSFGATIMTINKTAGVWILYQDTGSATQGMMTASGNNSVTNSTDEFLNTIEPGMIAYGGSSGAWTAIQITGTQVNFLTSTQTTQTTWNTQSQTIYTAGSAVTFNNGTLGFSFATGEQVSIAAGEGPFILGEGWHTISLPSSGGFSGTIRCKKLPWNMVAIDVQVEWTSTAGGTFTCGSLPDSSYYPTVQTPRSYPISVGDSPNTDLLPRLVIPASGALSIFVGASSSGSGTTAFCGTTITYPVN
ncbi:MAG TPA: hypothetical protein VNB49_10515 [Candidatus Dormibacteraeota bacterium]|nr:hypothetical protein [Candidatus Dormibacteraeota bacterium]